jgi:hypothetical protein
MTVLCGVAVGRRAALLLISVVDAEHLAASCGCICSAQAVQLYEALLRP